MSKNVKKELVPALRFPEFRDKRTWRLVRLNQLGKLVSGLTYRPDDVQEDGLLVLRSSNVQNGYISLEDKIYVRRDIKGANLSKPDDILICVRNGSKPLIGKNALIPKGMPLSTHGAFMTVFRSKSAKFVFQLFQTSAYERQVAADLGATINSINGNQFKKYEFYVPELEKEKQKISDCLSSLDELIAAHTQKHQALQSYKKGLLQNLFPAEGETTPALRFPEFRFSGGWMRLSIQELIDKDLLLPPKDGNHGNIHPKSSDFVNDGIPFIMASNLKSGKIDFVGCSKIKKEQADNLQKGFSEAGDVLLSHKGTVGEVAIVPESNFPYIMLTPQVTYYRAKNNEKINNCYLASAFLSEEFQNDLLVASGGGTRAYIGITAQQKLQLWVPENIDEQKRIADFLSSVEDLIATQSKKIEQLKIHKKGLMKKLFPSAGEVL